MKIIPMISAVGIIIGLAGVLTVERATSQQWRELAEEALATAHRWEQIAESAQGTLDQCLARTWVRARWVQ